MSKSKKGCTVCLKLASGILANQLLKNASPPKVFTSANTLQVTGANSGVALCSALSSTILD
jgi:hypothetical protein